MLTGGRNLFFSLLLPNISDLSYDASASRSRGVGTFLWHSCSTSPCGVPGRGQITNRLLTEPLFKPLVPEQGQCVKESIDQILLSLNRMTKSIQKRHKRADFGRRYIVHILVASYCSTPNWLAGWLVNLASSCWGDRMAASNATAQRLRFGVMRSSSFFAKISCRSFANVLGSCL